MKGISDCDKAILAVHLREAARLLRMAASPMSIGLAAACEIIALGIDSELNLDGGEPKKEVDPAVAVDGSAN
jgi:hypothetical protein